MATNAEWMVKNGYEFSSLHALPADKGKHGYDICIRTEKGWFAKLGEVDTVFNNSATAVFFWLDQEHKEPILDEAEKKYLSAVIKPFRDKVLSIQKSSGLYASQYFDEISVYYEIFGHDLCFDLPPFEKGTMYKGMKKDHDYTLEELGL